MKHALVTGASSGIGMALSRRLAARGYEVHLAARRHAELVQLAESIRADGHKATPFVLDVSKPEQAEERVRELDEQVGGIHLVVANAGIGGDVVPAHRQSLQGVRRAFETNFFGALATILPVLGGMIQRREGQLAVVSSLAAEIPLPAAVDYGTSKAAVSFYFESLMADAEQHGVGVTIVHPGFVKTPMTDTNNFKMPFLMDAEEAARIIDDGIAKRKRMVRFPLGLALSIRAGMALPRGMRAALINKKRPDKH